MKRSPSRRSTADHLVPPGLRTRLESARLELRAWLRTLDELHVAQHLPPELHALLELDADLAEALYVLDQPEGGFAWGAVTRDTLASLAQLPIAQAELMASLDASMRRRVTAHVPTVRATLRPTDAYLQIPGRDPQA